jgi:hypothetical protein
LKGDGTRIDVNRRMKEPRENDSLSGGDEIKKILDRFRERKALW